MAQVMARPGERKPMALVMARPGERTPLFTCFGPLCGLKLRKLSDALALGQQLGRLQRILCGEMRLKHLVRVLPLLLLLPPVLLRKVADRLVGQEVLGDLIAAEDGERGRDDQRKGAGSRGLHGSFLSANLVPRGFLRVTTMWGDGSA